MQYRRFSKLIALLTALMLLSCIAVPALAQSGAVTVSAAEYPVTRNGAYSSMEEVAVYIAAYGGLPQNFLTKKQAEALGWNNRKGNLNEVAPGCSIGGDSFGNYEGRVPSARGRKWTECDIGYNGGYRGGERIVFSSDGLIYYSGDHYETFRQVVVTTDAATSAVGVKIKKSGEYTSKDEVAAYLHQYGKLPKNYLTKSEAKALGWSNQKNNLDKVAPGCAIGGDEFQNRERLLPDKKGRAWYECDVNTVDGKRGKERVVYSSDGLIYYPPDNHKSFTRLY